MQWPAVLLPLDCNVCPSLSLSASTETLSTVARTADYIVAADGAYSAVRRQIITTPGFDYSQTFIEHGYLELSIPPTPTNESAMPEQYLHIWPRGHFMMIALPNKDCSWTVTLFMPLTKFQDLDSVQDVVDFFKQHFLDYVTLIGEEQLAKLYFSGKPQPLVMVKVRQSHAYLWSDKIKHAFNLFSLPPTHSVVRTTSRTASCCWAMRHMRWCRSTARG